MSKHFCKIISKIGFCKDNIDFKYLLDLILRNFNVLSFLEKLIYYKGLQILAKIGLRVFLNLNVKSNILHSHFSTIEAIKYD